MQDGRQGAATLRLDDAAADDLQLLLGGAYAPLDRYLTEAERAAVRTSGRLPDGAACELPLCLELPVEGPHPAAGDTVVLADAEAVPLATLAVTEVVQTDSAVQVAGGLVALGTRTADSFAHLRRMPSDIRAEATGPVLAVPTRRPLYAHDVTAVLELARARDAGKGGSVLLLVLAGAGTAQPEALVRSLLTAAGQIRAGLGGAADVRVRVLPCPRHEAIGSRGETRLAVRLADSCGADAVLLPHDANAGGAPAGDHLGDPELSVPVHHGPPGPLGHDDLQRLLNDGTALPAGFAAAEVERELRRMRPPARERGATLLFTGLSGSGKSTLARAVAAALAESGERTVTLLDGDRVRTLLSAGLTFSKADREANVRRIGYVAAEVTRHGGTAVAAPIAPYDATRREVRAMVQPHGEFLLIHVSTPLEVCEARDRKGLYALARAGKIPSFTGVSDPYEVPDDADLVVDTSQAPLDACTEQVLDLLHRRGLTAAPTPASTTSPSPGLEPRSRAKDGVPS